MEAIRHGFSVYFVSLPDLLDRLVQAQAENRMRRKMAHLRKCRLLILDEIGYRNLDRQATTLLFQLISERYERGSMIVTSNKAFGEWGSILGDDPTDPCQQRDDVPPELSTAVLLALDKNPRHRPPTATAFANLLTVATRSA